MKPPSVLDQRQRPLGSLRLSVTDRCNLRCGYCMPGEDYTWMPSKDLLTFEELARLSGIFAGLGATKLRLTGGEPLLRKNVEVLVKLLIDSGCFEEVAMTTNALGLAAKVDALKAAGLTRLTVSLDSLKREKVLAMSGRDALERVLAGLDAADAAGFRGTKLDTVAMRGFNDDELAEFLVFGKRRGIEVRFIEYMDVLGAVDWAAEKVISRREMLDEISEAVGADVLLFGEQGAAPAARFQLGERATLDGVDLAGYVFGIIASTTEPFCAACDRSRVTADGRWYQCLYAREGSDLRGPLRDGATDAELRALLTGSWSERAARGAEERLDEAERGAAARRDELSADHHLEMHKRGG